jgi:CheY-like chemotaxis protein
MNTPVAAPRLLAVDDEEAICQLVTRLLSRAGWETDYARDGAAALAKIAARRPDVVVLDVMMPGVDGLEFLRRLREQPEPPAVVATTGLADYATFAALVRGGAAAYLAKPFEARELVEVCERVLRSLKRRRGGPDERRQSPRRDIMVGVKVLSVPERGAVALGVLSNLSRGGAQVDLLTPLELGNRVKVALHAGAADTAVSFEGHICWQLALDHGFAHGIAFSAPSAELESQLSELLGAPEMREQG